MGYSAREWLVPPRMLVQCVLSTPHWPESPRVMAQMQAEVGRLSTAREAFKSVLESVGRAVRFSERFLWTSLFRIFSFHRSHRSAKTVPEETCPSLRRHRNNDTLDTVAGHTTHTAHAYGPFSERFSRRRSSCQRARRPRCCWTAAGTPPGSGRPWRSSRRRWAGLRWRPRRTPEQFASPGPPNQYISLGVLCDLTC